MKLLYKHLPIFVLMMAFANNAYTENENAHYKAAKKLYETTNIVDTEAMLNQMVSSMISINPEIEPYRDIFTDVMREVILSPEYEQLKVKSYMAFLNESELNELTTLFSSKAYAKFRKNQAKMLKISNDGILQLFNAKRGLLQSRIEARNKMMNIPSNKPNQH